MKPAGIRWGIFLAAAGLLVPWSWAGEERIDIPTYISVPTDRLHAGRATIGPPYRPEVVPDGSVPDGMLLVSGNVGVGTASPRSDPPSGAPTGNLDVNDLFIRSAGRWASQLSPGGGGPVVSGENSSGVTEWRMGSPLTFLLASVTIASAGRPIVAMGKVSARSYYSARRFVPMTVGLYRDGTLVDSVSFAPGYREFAVVMKTETLAAGNHLFELKVSFTFGGVVDPGAAKLTVMQM